MARPIHRLVDGSYPAVSLADARQKTADARKLREQGIDPIGHRDTQRAAQKAAAVKAITFDECCVGYRADHEMGWGAEHLNDWANSLINHVSPVFGSLPVAMVDTPFVLKVLRPIWRTKYPPARVLRERLEAVLDWAIASHYREGPNPARLKGHLDKILGRPEHIVRHHPALPYAEIGGLVAELKSRNDRDALCLLLLIHTATRVGAAVGACREEFDIAKRVWTIPASRMKRRGKRKALPFRVPLSDAAIKVVERVGVKEGPLFPSADHSSLAKAHGRTGITVHGFRSTFRDWCSEQTNYPREVIEMAMAHVAVDATEEAYFRSDLLEKRGRLMDAWAAYCSAPAGSNVVHGEFGRKAANEAPA